MVQRCCCSQEGEEDPPSLHLCQLHGAWASGCRFSCPLWKCSAPFLLSLPSVVVLTCGQAPCGHESVPMLLWVTLSVLHLAPCSLAARAVGRDTLRAASTLGTPYGNSGLLHTTQQAGCPPASHPSCPGSPPSREPVLCLCFRRGCSGCGHPHTPHLGS